MLHWILLEINCMRKQNKLRVTRYCFDDLKIRIALVTDLHDMYYGNLVEAICKEKPDLILLAGDIIERTDEKESSITYKQMEQTQTGVYGRNIIVEFIGHVLEAIFTNHAYGREHFGMQFIERVSKIAPTFYSLGNHEWYFTNNDYALFSKYGITVLDNSDSEIEIRGKKYLIGGLSTRYEMHWLEEFGKKQGYKILMCHHPEHYRCLIMNSGLDAFDLIVGGHYHGGQWRIKDRSVYVPRIGFMKKNMVGQFGKLVIGAGVVNTSRFPRWGNPCELVIIDDGTKR